MFQCLKGAAYDGKGVSVVSTTKARLMTFAEYQHISNPVGGRYELFHGELVRVADPVYRHTRAQWAASSWA